MNGKVNAKKLNIDSRAEYECNDGYILTGGNRFRKCLAGGSWSGKAPFCECKSCALLLFHVKQHFGMLHHSGVSLSECMAIHV